MASGLLSQIRKRFANKTTEELLAIWMQNDRTQWSDETFAAIHEILAERGAVVVPQGPAIQSRPSKPVWRSVVGLFGRIVFVIGCVIFAGVPATWLYPYPFFNWLWTAFLIIAILVLWLGALAMRISLRPPWSSDKPRLSFWFIGWLALGVIGASGCLVMPFAQMPPEIESLLFVVGTVGPILCLMLLSEFRPRMLVLLAVVLVSAFTFVTIPSQIVAIAAAHAARRVADVNRLQDRLGKHLTESAWRSAVESPLPSQTTSLRSRDVVVCMAQEQTDGSYLLNPTPIESFLPREWRWTVPADASFVFVLHGPIEVKMRLFGGWNPESAVTVRVMPVLVFEWPEGNLIASGSVPIQSPWERRSQVDTWDGVRRVRADVASVVRVLDKSRP